MSKTAELSTVSGVPVSVTVYVGPEMAKGPAGLRPVAVLDTTRRITSYTGDDRRRVTVMVGDVIVWDGPFEIFDTAAKVFSVVRR